MPAVEMFGGRRRQRERQLILDALAHERSRIAADVHDLVMQDLALALATLRTLSADPHAAPGAAGASAAAERAMQGARDVVTALLAERRAPVVDALGEGVRAAARDVPLSFSADGVPAGAEPDGATLDTLVHIGREAVTNAVKHASPRSIEVVLAQGDEWRLAVTDDGQGFDAAGGGAPHLGGGFGLASMERAARALGGRLTVASAAGSGTVIEAILP